MIHITKELEEFIEKSIHFIESNTKECWERIYDALDQLPHEFFTPPHRGQFTTIMLKCDLDPAEKLGYIMDNYLRESECKYYEVPDTVETIGFGAFQASELEKVKISNSVKTIGEYAFGSCSSLEDVQIGNNVQILDKCAFSNCKSIKTITLPKSLVIIGDWCFSSCDNLEEIVYQGTKKELLTIVNPRNKKWRDGSPIERIVCNDGIIKLHPDNNKVAHNSYIPVAINDTEYGIDGNIAVVLKQLQDVSTVRIPPNITYNNVVYDVTRINDSAFTSCYNLTNVEIGKNITSIGRNAFHLCSSLTDITIPKSVTTIGERAFMSCNKLTEIKFEGTKDDIIKLTAKMQPSKRWTKDSSIRKITCIDGDLSVDAYGRLME